MKTGAAFALVLSFCAAACGIPATWAEWWCWEPCSVTCGGGVRERSRSCKAGSTGRADCSGKATESGRCSTLPCPATWSEWTRWGACTVTCGGGYQVRNRSCTPGTSGKRDCSGENGDTEICNQEACKVFATWTEWLCWGPCSVTCGGGVRVRSRFCRSSSNGRTDCSDSATESEKCSTSPCPDPAAWETWSDWGRCKSTCAREKVRSCRRGTGNLVECLGNYIDRKECDPEICQEQIIASETSTFQTEDSNCDEITATQTSTFQTEDSNCGEQQMKGTTITVLYAVLGVLLSILIISWACCYAKLRRRYEQPVCREPLNVKALAKENDDVCEKDLHTYDQPEDSHFEMLTSDACDKGHNMYEMPEK